MALDSRIDKQQQINWHTKSINTIYTLLLIVFCFFMCMKEKKILLLLSLISVPFFKKRKKTTTAKTIEPSRAKPKMKSNREWTHTYTHINETNNFFLFRLLSYSVLCIVCCSCCCCCCCCIFLASFSMSFYVVYIVPSGGVSASLFLLTAIYFLPHTTSDSNSDYELFFSRRFLFHLVTHLFSNDELKIRLT